jgi:hypothetical protein
MIVDILFCKMLPFLQQRNMGIGTSSLPPCADSGGGTLETAIHQFMCLITHFRTRLTLGGSYKGGERRKHLNKPVIPARFVFVYQARISDAGAMSFAVVEVEEPRFVRHADDVISVHFSSLIPCAASTARAK